MRRMKMNIQKIEWPFEPIPIGGLKNDASGIAIVHRNPLVDARLAKRDPHALIFVMRFEATEGKLARNCLGVLVAQLLGGENVDLVVADEIDEPVRVGPSPPEIPRKNANRPRQTLLLSNYPLLPIVSTSLPLSTPRGPQSSFQSPRSALKRPKSRSSIPPLPPTLTIETKRRLGLGSQSPRLDLLPTALTLAVFPGLDPIERRLDLSPPLLGRLAIHSHHFLLLHRIHSRNPPDRLVEVHRPAPLGRRGHQRRKLLPKLHQRAPLGLPLRTTLTHLSLPIVQKP